MRTPDNAAAYMPAIDALRSDLAHLEQEAAMVRALLDGLERRAGIACLPAAAGEAAMVPKAKGTRGNLRGRKPGTGRGKGGGKGSSAGRAKSEPPAKDAATLAELGVSKKQSKPDDKVSAEELRKVVAVIADAAAQAEVATRDKDAAKLGGAVAEAERGQRRAGELLAAMNGRVRPLPGTETEKRRWRAAVLLSASDFEKRVRRSQRRALAAIGVGPAKAKPSPRPQQSMKISAWKEEPDGSRSRTVTAVDGGAEAL